MVPPVADQVTLVGDNPVTLTENCSVPPVCNVGEGGETETDLIGTSGGVPGLAALPAEPVQELSASNATARQAEPSQALIAFTIIGIA